MIGQGVIIRSFENITNEETSEILAFASKEVGRVVWGIINDNWLVTLGSFPLFHTHTHAHTHITTMYPTEDHP